MTAHQSLSEEDEAIEAVYQNWFETSAEIRGRDLDNVIKIVGPGQLYFNEIQTLIDQAVNWCELNDVPCRIIVLKNRKEGATTHFVGKSYHMLRSRCDQELIQIGDDGSTTQLMWDMLKTFNENDSYQWANKNKQFLSSAKAGAKAEWTNGSKASTETAGDSRAGQGHTPSIIHCEEVASWGKDGSAASATDTMLALLSAIPEGADTCVFVSSTANGVGNWYHRTYKGAVSLQERMRGDKGNGWIRIFFPWHRSLWARQPVTEAEIEEIKNSLDDHERTGISLYGWNWEQLAWRRNQIKSKCDGSVEKFNQENPSDDTSCFLTSGSPVFNQTKLSEMEAYAKTVKWQRGTLAKSGSGVIFMPNESGWFLTREDPAPGLKYLIAADPAGMKEPEPGVERDAHSIGGWRAAYRDTTGVSYPDRKICRIVPPCQVLAPLLGEYIELMHLWLGKALVVPERNNTGGGALLEQLRNRKIKFYIHKSHSTANGGRITETEGWETTEKSRREIIDNLAFAINQDDIDIGDLHAIDECKTFVRKANGREEADSRCHDDDVLEMAIARKCMPFATLYPIPRPVDMNFKGKGWPSDYLREGAGSAAPGGMG